jgi:outer membrane protein assembly factor BamB
MSSSEKLTFLKYSSREKKREVFVGRTQSRRRTVPAVVIASALIVSGAAADAQWPQWRGPTRDGLVPPAQVPGTWPSAPTVKWKQPVGEGYSSPVVADGRVFVHSRTSPAEFVSAFDLQSGKPLWSARYDAAFTKSQYAREMSGGPFSTPIVFKDRLFTLGVTAVLSSFDTVSGALKWRKDYSQGVSTAKLFTGTAMSPLIDSGLLIVHVGDDTAGAFRAFDPISGAEKWTLPGHGPGYASPVVATGPGGTRQFVTMTDSAIVGIDVATGALLWTLPFPDEWHENIVTPIVAGNILVLSGTRKGTFGYRLGKSGPPTQVWHNTDLPMYLSSPVAAGRSIYGFSVRRKGQLFCLDAETGQARWTTEGRFGGNASLLSAPPNLVVLTTEGDLVVVKQSPEKFEELKRFKVAESQTWAHPVLLGSDLLIRSADSLALWSLR